MLYTHIPFWNINKKSVTYYIKGVKHMDKTIFTKSHKDLVSRLVKARKSAKLKQVDVAKKLGRTQSYISKLESGQRRVDTVQLSELAAIYKKNLRYFIE